MPQRLLSDLKVVELRKELARRGADKSGMKPALMERLKEIILREGRDPLTYDFSKSDEKETIVIIEDSDAKSEIAVDDVLTEEISVSDNNVTNLQENNDNEEKTGSHLTAVSDGSIGIPEALELEDRGKEDAVDQIEDTTTFEVGVGETENDLDYDIEEPLALSNEQEKDSIKEQKSKGEEPNESVGPIQENSVKLQTANTSSSQVEEPTSQDQSPNKNVTSVNTLTFLRVSNLRPITKAAELKQHFSVYGNVISGKILVCKRRPGGCVGFLTLATPEDAAMCIKKLDGTEYNGRTIKVEKTEQIPNAPQKKPLILEKSRLSTNPGNQTAVGSSVSPKSRRHNIGGKRPDSTRYAKRASSTHRSNREIIKSIRNSKEERAKRPSTTLAKSQLKRTLQKAHGIASSKTKASRSPRRPNSPARKRPRKLEPKPRASREDERSRPKSPPRPRESYLEHSSRSSRHRSPRRKTPSPLSRVRYVEREMPIRLEEHARHSYSERESRRESYSIRPQREMYEEPRYDGYHHEPRYSAPYHPVEVLSARHYPSKPPIAYRRQEEEELPTRYSMEERSDRSRYREGYGRYDSSIPYERSRDYEPSSHGDRYPPPDFDSRSYDSRDRRYGSYSRSSRDDRPSNSSKRREDPNISWRSSHSSSRRRAELEMRSPPRRPRSPRRSRSPLRHRPPRDLNESKSPARFSRRPSPPPPPQRSRNEDYAHHHAPPPPQHQQVSSSSAYFYSHRSGGNDRSSFSSMMPSMSESISTQNEPRRTEKVFDYGHKSSSAPKYDWNDSNQSRSRGGAGYESTTGGFSANGTADTNRGGVGRSGGGVIDFGVSRWSLMGNPPRPPRY